MQAVQGSKGPWEVRGTGARVHLLPLACALSPACPSHRESMPPPSPFPLALLSRQKVRCLFLAYCILLHAPHPLTGEHMRACMHGWMHVWHIRAQSACRALPSASTSPCHHQPPAGTAHGRQQALVAQTLVHALACCFISSLPLALTRCPPPSPALQLPSWRGGVSWCWRGNLGCGSILTRRWRCQRWPSGGLWRGMAGACTRCGGWQCIT